MCTRCAALRQLHVGSSCGFRHLAIAQTPEAFRQAYLADIALQQHLRRHMGHGAVAVALDALIGMHVTGKPKVCNLGTEAMGTDSGLGQHNIAAGQVLQVQACAQTVSGGRGEQSVTGSVKNRVCYAGPPSVCSQTSVCMAPTQLPICCQRVALWHGGIDAQHMRHYSSTWATRVYRLTRRVQW